MIGFPSQLGNNQLGRIQLGVVPFAGNDEAAFSITCTTAVAVTASSLAAGVFSVIGTSIVSGVSIGGNFEDGVGTAVGTSTVSPISSSFGAAVFGIVVTTTVLATTIKNTVIPVSADFTPQMPKAIIRIQMPAAAITQIFTKKAKFLSPLLAQDDCHVPATDQ